MTIKNILKKTIASLLLGLCLGFFHLSFLQKSYLLAFHAFSGVFLSGGFILCMCTLFKVPWSKKFKDMIPLWRRLAPQWVFLFLPLLFFARELFPWDEFQGHKKFYFSHWFILLRTLCYLSGAYYAVKVMEKKQAVALMIFFFLTTFFAVDWGMSLQGEWSSNMYGLLYLINSGFGLFALVTFAVAEKSDVKVRQDLFHLLVSFAVSWGYLHYSQFLIFWMGNKPNEVSWYIQRGFFLNHWPTFLIACLKFLPLVFIAPWPWLKSKAPVLRGVSALILLGYLMEVSWFISPGLDIGLISGFFTSLLFIIPFIFALRSWARVSA